MKMRNEIKNKMERTEEILNRDMPNLDKEVMWSTLPHGMYEIGVSKQMTLDGYVDEEKKGEFFPVLNLSIDPKVLLTIRPEVLANRIRWAFNTKYNKEKWYEREWK
tara:strand:+ start:1363 stop:1680 length:318 start_codon:yes stop_codon:yes gene_type:complete